MFQFLGNTFELMKNSCDGRTHTGEPEGKMYTPFRSTCSAKAAVNLSPSDWWIITFLAM